MTAQIDPWLSLAANVVSARIWRRGLVGGKGRLQDKRPHLADALWPGRSLVLQGFFMRICDVWLWAAHRILSDISAFLGIFAHRTGLPS